MSLQLAAASYDCLRTLRFKEELTVVAFNVARPHLLRP